MKKIMGFALLSCLFSLTETQAQTTPVALSNLNTWSGQSAFIGWYNTQGNVPSGQVYGNGVQLALPQDNRFGAQIVIPTYENQIYYRRNQAGTWDPWYKVYSSANLNKTDVDFSCNLLTSKTADVSGDILLRNMNNKVGGGVSVNFSSYDAAHPGPKISSYLDYASGTNSQSRLVLSSYSGGYKNELTLMYGNVGIGTMNPQERLSVNGKIRAQEIKVEQANWPDYVFAGAYELMGLNQLKDYIQQHNHLPDMPSAAEVADQGINLGEMNAKLLKKVEELTLYLLEKDSELKNEKDKNAAQQLQLTRQQQSIDQILVRLQAADHAK